MLDRTRTKGAKFERLKTAAGRIRLLILEAVYGAGKGHIGGAFSIVEILVALYHGESLRHKPSDPEWKLRDRFVLSKGHAGVALYSVLADRGYFDVAHLAAMNRGGLLSEHPDPRVPGIEVVTGSLGHGLSVAAGMAFELKVSKQSALAYALLGDGECNEGSVWEAAMFASHHSLGNLCAIVDRNGLITHGSTEDFNGLEPFAEKWRAFGWIAVVCDGHDLLALSQAFAGFKKNSSGKPLVIIAQTIKGKGISFMEGIPTWHHGPIGSAVYDSARLELQKGKMNGD